MKEIYAKNLVIVESPTKAKTIEKFLDKDYKVLSSYGHIRDLKSKELSIDIHNDFKPEYIISPDKIEVVKQLKKATKEAEIIWLASDEDREGEAIAWHLYIVLGLQEKKSKRIVFHEITKNAILSAIEHPRNINFYLVEAQQARRVLDRIVGFELSPILWRKIMPSLSAGRVQSVAVRLIVEKEREINNFITESSFHLWAQFLLPNGKTIVRSKLNKYFKTEEEAKAFLEVLKDKIFTIEDISIHIGKKSPAPPFTTSTLQQEASHKAGFNVSQTMSIAQKLYEFGLITYMRTDSVTLSPLALNDIQKEIINEFGDKYVKIRQYHTKTKGAQEAHEAIRPTFINDRTIKGTVQEQRLYQLIWERTIASQMADTELERTTVTIGINNNATDKFCIQGVVIKFDGFLRVCIEKDTNNLTVGENVEATLPPMQLNEILNLIEATASEQFTQRPSRYTEASLVRKLEKLGIGRPSTYAPTISTIQHRGYVVKRTKEGKQRLFTTLTLKNKTVSKQAKIEIVGADKNKLIPTDSGIIVNDFLIKHFPHILEYNFTADLEKEFDKIAEGKLKWIEILRKFYNLFHPIVEKVSSTKTEYKVGERILGVNKNKKLVSAKIGRFGPFVQIGSAEDEEKPQFAPLTKRQSIENITLEEALTLFDLPRTIGILEDKPITIAIGRFGPYLKFGNIFISIPEKYDPYHITIEEVKKIIKDKKKQDENKIIKSFSENKDLKILNGRFGAYIAYARNNYKIPKGIILETISYMDVMKIIEENPKQKKKVSVTKKR